MVLYYQINYDFNNAGDINDNFDRFIVDFIYLSINNDYD